MVERTENKEYHAYKKDVKTSEAIRKAYAQRILPKDCYNNIYRLATTTNIMLHYELRIAYGYVYSSDISGRRAFVRHCFFVDSHDTVIDPTLPEERNGEHYIIKAFDFNEYLDVLLEYRNPDFSCLRLMIPLENDFILWAASHGILCFT